jgi:hypothetical protein
MVIIDFLFYFRLTLGTYFVVFLHIFNIHQWILTRFDVGFHLLSPPLLPSSCPPEPLSDSEVALEVTSGSSNAGGSASQLAEIPPLSPLLFPPSRALHCLPPASSPLGPEWLPRAQASTQQPPTPVSAASPATPASWPVDTKGGTSARGSVKFSVAAPDATADQSSPEQNRVAAKASRLEHSNLVLSTAPWRSCSQQVRR